MFWIIFSCQIAVRLPPRQRDCLAAQLTVCIANYRMTQVPDRRMTSEKVQPCGLRESMQMFEVENIRFKSKTRSGDGNEL